MRHWIVWVCGWMLFGSVFGQDTLANEFPSSTHCWFPDAPEPINLEEVKASIYLPHATWEMEGKVILRVYFDAGGNYVKHIVLKSPHPILIPPVEAAIRNLKVQPIYVNGRPIKSCCTIPFNIKDLRKELLDTAH